MGQKQSSKKEKKEKKENEEPSRVDERKVKSRLMTLYILENYNRRFGNYNWIQKILYLHTTQSYINKYFTSSTQISASMDNIWYEFNKLFDGKNFDVVILTQLFKQRKSLLKITEQAIVAVDSETNRVDGRTFIEKSFRGSIEYLLLLMETPPLGNLDPVVSELENYIIQIYICINILARHVDHHVDHHVETGDVKLLFDRYNYRFGQDSNYYHLFASNLTIDFLDHCLEVDQKSNKIPREIPREILSIIIEYDQLVGERLLAPGVESLIYSRVTFPEDKKDKKIKLAEIL